MQFLLSLRFHLSVCVLHPVVHVLSPTRCAPADVTEFTLSTEAPLTLLTAKWNVSQNKYTYAGKLNYLTITNQVSMTGLTCNSLRKKFQKYTYMCVDLFVWSVVFCWAVSWDVTGECVINGIYCIWNIFEMISS